MPTPDTQRRLVTVIKADIVGYTKLMGEHEDETMQAWWACRNDIIDPQIQTHRGKIVKHTGDGFLAEFPSALDAMQCAIEMQTGLERRNLKVAKESRIEFRMGLNLCDVLADEEDIYGDGVNVAARIEVLADPGGICVTPAVQQQVKGKVAAEFEDLGRVDLKNLTEPLRVFKVLPPEKPVADFSPEVMGDASIETVVDPTPEWIGKISFVAIVVVILAGIIMYVFK